MSSYSYPALPPWPLSNRHLLNLFFVHIVFVIFLFCTLTKVSCILKTKFQYLHKYSLRSITITNDQLVEQISYSNFLQSHNICAEYRMCMLRETTYQMTRRVAPAYGVSGRKQRLNGYGRIAKSMRGIENSYNNRRAYPSVAYLQIGNDLTIVLSYACIQ